jgi:choloylglycine hydrolase
MITLGLEALTGVIGIGIAVLLIVIAGNTSDGVLPAAHAAALPACDRPLPAARDGDLDGPLDRVLPRQRDDQFTARALGLRGGRHSRRAAGRGPWARTTNHAGDAFGDKLRKTAMCTRVLWNNNNLGVLAGRTMDWPESTEPELIVAPRDYSRHGGKLGPATVIKENALEWKSRYGSIIVSVYGVGTVDGFNEKGFATHALYLESTELAGPDPGKAGLQIALWAQYLLDNAASVDEAINLMRDIQLVMVEAHGHKATLHLAVEDAGGDSAIMENIGGELVIHHGPQYRLMTNDPSYEEQLHLLGGQDFSKPSCDLPIPGNVNPVDRFQRAAYFSALLPEPHDEREAAASVLSIMRNVSVPFGAPYGDFGIYNTEYRTVADLTNLRYFFELSTSPNLVWAELDRFNLGNGEPVRVLDPDDITLYGEVSDKFQPAEIAF